jgi:hypothetical protein
MDCSAVHHAIRIFFSLKTEYLIRGCGLRYTLIAFAPFVMLIMRITNQALARSLILTLQAAGATIRLSQDR